MARRRLGAALVIVLAAGCSLGSGGSASDLGLGDALDPTLGNPGYDVGHYQIDLTFDPSSRRLDASVTLTATATADLASVNVDFIGFTVDGVTMQGSTADFGRTRRDLTVRPRTSLTHGEQFELAVRYHGTPEPFRSSAGLPMALGWNVSPGGDPNYVFAEPDAARSWFPCNDHPSDRATFDFRLTVPNGLVAAANGVLRDRVAAAQRTTWVWRMDRPMATYLATVIIGNYRIVDDPAATAAAGVPIRNVLPADESGLAQSGVTTQELGRQGEMLAFLRGYLGPYPFAAYGIALVPGTLGALEAQTLTVSSTTAPNVLAHELAHQWLGDWVSLERWQDIWLNEGFATYMEWLWDEHAGDATLADLAARAYEQDAGLPPPGPPPMTALFNHSVYGRGALTLAALRARVGDAAFFATLRTWVDRYGGRSATTEDFIGLAEEVSGADLGALFDAWLYGETMPPLPAVPSPPAPSTPASGSPASGSPAPPSPVSPAPSASTATASV